MQVKGPLNLIFYFINEFVISYEEIISQHIFKDLKILNPTQEGNYN